MFPEENRCKKCGKFFKYSDIDNGSCWEEEVWSWGKMEVLYIARMCPVCTKNTQKQ